jgi:hypothetical protein
VDAIDLEVETIQLIGGAGADRFNAADFTRGRVILEGNGGADVLMGGAGDDRLIGGGGDDTLRGGGGNDTYVFAPAQPGGTDTITELVGNGADDVVDLSAGTAPLNTVELAQAGVAQVVNANLTLILSSANTIERVVYPPAGAPLNLAAVAAEAGADGAAFGPAGLRAADWGGCGGWDGVLGNVWGDAGEELDLLQEATRWKRGAEGLAEAGKLCRAWNQGSGPALSWPTPEDVKWGWRLRL